MLVSTDIISRIDEIVERAYTGFIFDVIGDDFLSDEQKRWVESLGLIVGRKPLIDLLYLLVRQRTHPNYRDSWTLLALLDDLSRTGLLSLPDRQQYTLDHAKSKINSIIESVKSDIKKKVYFHILKANDEFKIELSRPTPDLPISEVAREKKESALGKLLLLTGIAAAVAQPFERDFTSSMTELVNDAVVDEVETLTKISGDKDPKVYKEVVNDGRLCIWCRAFHLNPDGTPIIYRLKELIRNGDNIGKPREAWLPVVGPVHVRCRCQLKYLQNNDGNIF